MTSILLSKLIGWWTVRFGLQWCAFYDVALFDFFFFLYNYFFAIQEMIAYPFSAFCICKLLPFSLYDTDNSSTFIKVTVWINNCFSMWKTGKDHCRLYYKLQSRKNKGIVDIWNDWELTQTGYYGSLFPPRDKQKVIVSFCFFSLFWDSPITEDRL